MNSFEQFNLPFNFYEIALFESAESAYRLYNLWNVMKIRDEGGCYWIAGRATPLQRARKHIGKSQCFPRTT